MRTPHVFTIAAGAPFLQTFVAALLDGQVVEGFSRGVGPLDMADATIYVPTQRAARALADALATALDRPATLLPRILPLGALDATETSLLFEEPGWDGGLEAGLPQAATEVARRMQLAHLILEWSRLLHHAIVAVDPEGRRTVDAAETCIVASSFLDAWHLSGDLTRLIDEMIIEDIAWARLDPLVLPEFDRYWRITMDFLDIAITEWPKILAERGLVDAARRQVQLIDAQSARILSGRSGGPVIAIGSTGSNRATAKLLAAIARAPQGAVVLPGLDLDLDEGSFARIAPVDDAAEPAFGHPQAALGRLIKALQVERADVVPLGTVEPALALRGAFVSQALRPADTTELWTRYRRTTDAETLASALAGVALIEAADEREEALALAVAMREVLETPAATAALVTPDRELARRVRAELLRWNIEVDDSAGEPLSANPLGLFARQVAACAASGGAPEHVVALLVHPLTRLGLPRGEVETLAPLYEVGVLRAPLTASQKATPPTRIAAARELAAALFAHPAKKRITPALWDRLEDLAARIDSALAPLTALRGAHPLTAWIDAHRACLATVGGDVAGEAYEALEALFDELTRTAFDAMRLDAEAYALFFAQVAADVPLPGPRRTHPRLKIFGLLEARLMQADTVLLGGLDETVWPPQARSDAFLNRPMRAVLGLSPPERRLGQTAHDFAQAMGSPRVVLSRALKRGGAPTVPSRFVQRAAALGHAAWGEVCARGAVYRDFARALDRPADNPVQLCAPTPRPPLHLRPTRLSVTRIEMLRRDPYAIYAEFCLKLIELPPLGLDESQREIGTAVHAVLETFTRRHATGALPPDASVELTESLQTAFKDQLADPDFAAFQWPRMRRAVDFYVAFEARRRGGIAHIEVEAKGVLDIVLSDGSVFKLSGTADRIEHNRDGSVTLVDYKTGTPPGTNEVLVGFAPQLTLEAAMAARGAFGLPPGTPVSGALYVKLGGSDGGKETDLVFDRGKIAFADVVETHYANLLELLEQFRDEATHYPARPFPKFAARYNVYDHLARSKEWAAAGADEGAA